MVRKLKQFLHRVHGNEQGNIAVMLILIGWVFVGLLALLWNMGEYGARRKHMQIAADSAANAAEVWRARTMNLIAASNMVIGENASAEIIYRAIQMTDKNVNGQLNSEQTQVANRLNVIAQQLAQMALQPGGGDPYTKIRLQLEQGVLQRVAQSLPLQLNNSSDFHALTESAFNMMLAEDFAPRRLEVFENYQRPVVAMLPRIVEEQRDKIAADFNVDITLAKTGDPADPTMATVAITPPLKEINYVNIVPIVHQGLPVNDGTRDVRITGGSWGEIDDPPLTRYVTDRVWRDSSGQARILRNLMVAIDAERQTLRNAVTAYLTPGRGTTDPVILQAFRDMQLAMLGIGYVAPWYSPGATSRGSGHLNPFAEGSWNDAIRNATAIVLHGMGEDPWQFVLQTYDLYDIPDWAKPQVYQSAYQNVYTQVYQNNYVRILLMRYQELEKAEPKPISNARERAIQQEATAYAQPITAKGAAWIAEDVATQWIAQKWPYEIVPPQTAEPMPPGIRTEDRLAYYTLIAGARANDQTSTKPMLGSMFGKGEKLVAYAQAETFNWMEYNGGYGASDVYTVWYPPLPWRVSTRGGWSWNPRLAFADGLGAAMTNNVDFREYMDSAGVINYDPGPLKVLNQH